MSVTFEVGHKKFKIPLNGGCLVTVDHNLVPRKFARLCSEYHELKDNMFVCKSNYVYPYLNPYAFSLFINLMLTPTGLEIYNPKNLGLLDLEPIFHTFAHYPGTDDHHVNSLKARFQKQ